MNDPNGLVHAAGVFHLCYQHHPDGLVWGPMHWGHATSRDLLTWEHQPIALVPDHLGTAFSGSAVVDRDGVAGFGAGALVAFFTHFQEDVPQAQGVAFSVDGGTTWRPYDGNPVLRAPEGLVDFRDPKVFRFQDSHWVMVVAALDEVALFGSTDLLHWEPLSTFGRGHGAHGGTWETPDLFEVPVDGTSESRWVLVVSVLGGGPAGGSGTQYFLGDFDGTAFTSDDPGERVRWVDHGADFYAPQSWSDAPDGRRIWIAWLSNWEYGRTTPASTWRGAMTLPRDVALCRAGGEVVLAQQPVRGARGPARRGDRASRPAAAAGHAVGAAGRRRGVRPAAARGPGSAPPARSASRCTGEPRGRPRASSTSRPRGCSASCARSKASTGWSRGAFRRCRSPWPGSWTCASSSTPARSRSSPTVDRWC